MHPERIFGDGKAVYYSEGLFMGYRWFDENKIKPLFPFGYGLSYTKFLYSDLHIKSDHGRFLATFSVMNSGKHVGSEVPQVYIGPAKNVPNVIMVPRKLVGFDRIILSPGQKKWWKFISANVNYLIGLLKNMAGYYQK